MRKLTDQQLADIADVSPTTVSRVRSGKGYVSKRTRERVINAARQQGVYLGQRTVVALIVPDARNPFFSELCFRFERRFEDAGMQLVFSSSDADPLKESELIERFRAMGARGLIYISADSDRGGHALRTLALDRDGIAVVVFDRQIPGAAYDTVSVNSRSGTLQAVDYLVAHGHKRIAYIKGRERTETARERFESFLEAMARNRLSVDERLVFDGDYEHASGVACAERVIGLEPTERPTALLAANDMMAIGLIQRLQQAGWDLPRQLSVVGFDNISWSNWIHPVLTTIAQPLPQMVNVAVRMITERLQEAPADHAREPRTELIEPKLKPGASVGVPWTETEGLRLIGD